MGLLEAQKDPVGLQEVQAEKMGRKEVQVAKVREAVQWASEGVVKVGQVEEVAQLAQEEELVGQREAQVDRQSNLVATSNSTRRRRCQRTWRKKYFCVEKCSYFQMTI